jgi:hypothetical protein
VSTSGPNIFEDMLTKCKMKNPFLYTTIAVSANTLLMLVGAESLDMTDFYFRKNHSQMTNYRLSAGEEERRLGTRDYVVENDIGITDSSVLSSGRFRLWNKTWDLIDSFKSNTNVWDLNSPGRPTLNRFHLFILPIRWDGESTPPFDTSVTVPDYDKTVQYYRDMSWNKHEMTYEFHGETVDLIGVTAENADFDNSEKATYDIVSALGKTPNQDFSGISILYEVAKLGPFSGEGGWAQVNGKCTP